MTTTTHPWGVFLDIGPAPKTMFGVELNPTDTSDRSKTMELIDNIELAYTKGQSLGEHHPLTVYIEMDAFVVADGNETLFSTLCPEVLKAFLDGWRKAHIKTA